MPQPTSSPSRLRSTLLVALLGTLVTTAPSSHALAAKATVQSDTEAGDSPLYRKLIKDGLAEYDAFHFEEARSIFLRAHAMSPSARTYRAIGMTCFELRDYVSAVRNLSAALKDERRPLSPDQRTHAEGLLARSRMFVDAFTLTVSPSSTRVLVDGAAMELEPDGSLLLGAGSHTLEARAPGMVGRSFPVSVKGGGRRQLTITLEPEARARTSTAPTNASRRALVDAPAPSNRAAKTWLIAGGATGLAAVAAGIVWMGRNSELNSCHSPDAGWRCTNEATLSDQKNLAMSATLVAGAAAVTMGIVGLLSWHSAPVPSRQASLSCGLSPFGLSCGQAF